MTDNPEKMEKRRVFAIIPAAGRGDRMGADRNKQFLELGGVPILARTLQIFEKSHLIDDIVIVTNASEKQIIQNLCKEYNITKCTGIATGGVTRQDSVRNALSLLSGSMPGNDGLVLIHDGARPFVSEEVIKRCIDGLKYHHACGAGVRVKDTIKQVREDGRIMNTPPRKELWAIQTPQAFLFSLIEKLHNRAFADSLSFTDDCAVAEYYGISVYMVEGEYQNIKITTQEDLLYGEVLLNKINKETDKK